ncbi:unnamed protein product [Rotaria sp. Silwood1]|nr:unnamed protein product [Rotaria sp. Silwood1]CAF1487246.1 unnamed protein product [Rotaria sp. Silwood1]
MPKMNNVEIPKLKCFILKSKIHGDCQLVYLKWILNNVNHIEKLKLYLDINLTHENNLMKNKSIIDANFISQYCMLDVFKYLIDFHFYIVSKCQLLPNDIQIIEDSFKNHYFFSNHHWINVKCFFDPIMSYQHLSSMGIVKPKLFPGIIIDYPNIFHCQHMKYLKNPI